MVSKKGRCRRALRCSIIILFLSVLLIGGVTRESSGASEEERVSRLVEGARAEGKMVLYTTMNVSDSSRTTKRFEEKYPFIKVELYRAPSNTLINKITTEAKARKYIPDVVEIPGFNAFLLKKERLYTSYISPENRAFPEEFKDPEGNWTSTYVLLFGMAYNTTMVSRRDIPDTYEGFLHPRWKGKKIGFFDAKETEWFANMLKIMGEEKGMDFFRKFVAQELNHRSGQMIITDLISAGEFPIGTSFPQIVEERKKQGAKVDWAGVSPVIAKLGTIGLAAHAAHPNAAKLYIDLCLSREGQLLIESFGRVPARSDVESDILKTLRGVKIYPSDMTLADKFTVYRKQFDDVLRRDRTR